MFQKLGFRRVLIKSEKEEDKTEFLESQIEDLLKPLVFYFDIKKNFELFCFENNYEIPKEFKFCNSKNLKISKSYLN